MTDFLLLLVVGAAAYLLGTVPFGLLLTRWAGLGDIRSIGSGNIGATNVLRTGNRGLAAATLAGDLLKGTAAVLLGRYLEGDAGALMAAAGVMTGHIFPVWLNFKGGKGVATYIGILLGYFWPLALAFAAIWLGVAWLSRYSSLSAIAATALSPLLMAIWGGTGWAAVVFLLLAVLVIGKHAANIDRLLAGTESRIGDRSKSTSAASPPQPNTGA